MWPMGLLFTFVLSIWLKIICSAMSWYMYWSKHIHVNSIQILCSAHVKVQFEMFHLYEYIVSIKVQQHFLQWEVIEREVLWLRQTRPPVVVGVALNISLLLKCHIIVKANGYVLNTVHFINSLKHQGLLSVIYLYYM